VRDEAQIAKLRAQLESSTDPVAKLKAMASIQQAQDVNGGEARDAFMAVAKQWADSEGIGVPPFLEMGVPTADLTAAGFPVRGRRRPAATTTPRRRSTGVRVADVKAATPSVSKRFTVKDLQTASGGTNATVRKALAELVADGTITKLGPDPDSSARGRSPILYQRT